LDSKKKVAVRSMQRASKIHADSGRFTVAAKAELDIAAIYEAQGNLTDVRTELEGKGLLSRGGDGRKKCTPHAFGLGLLPGRSVHIYHSVFRSLTACVRSAICLFQATVHFQRSADFYETDGMLSNRDGVILRVARLMGLLGKYTEAHERFEAVAQACANCKLRKFGARDHLLKAVICLLATGDNVAVRKALDRCASISSDWAGSREARFLGSLVSAAERSDESAFSAVVQDYDSLLDQWKTIILAKAKEKTAEKEHAAELVV
jgi:hypothetical protein